MSQKQAKTTKINEKKKRERERANYYTEICNYNFCHRSESGRTKVTPTIYLSCSQFFRALDRAKRG